MTKLTNQPVNNCNTKFLKKVILQNSVTYNFGMDLQTESDLKI